MDEEHQFDVCKIIAVSYELRVIEMRTEFYRLDAEDPVYANILLPGLERLEEIAVTADLDATLHQLESYRTIQLMNAVEALTTSSDTKRTKCRVKPANDNGC